MSHPKQMDLHLPTTIDPVNGSPNLEAKPFAALFDAARGVHATNKAFERCSAPESPLLYKAGPQTASRASSETLEVGEIKQGTGAVLLELD